MIKNKLRFMSSSLLICLIAISIPAVCAANNGDGANGDGANNGEVYGPAPAPTYKSGDEAIREVARQLTSQLRMHTVDTIFVRHFRGPGSNELHLTNLLVEILDRNFTIGPGGVEIEGRVRALDNSGAGTLEGYRISVNLEGPDDSINFPGASVDVSNDIEAHEKLSETDTPRPQPPEVAGQPFEDVTAQKPAISELIRDSRVYASPTSPYSMEILIQDENGEFSPRKPFVQDGALVINLERGETYKVRVYNDSAYESFAKLNIDGLGRFALARNQGQRRNIDLVKPNKERDFVGYYLTPQAAASFVVGEYEESVAKRLLGDAADIGTISVTFGCTYSGEVPSFEKEVKTVYRQETETVMVPKVVRVPRTITEQVPVENNGESGSNWKYRTTGKQGGNKSGGGVQMRTRQRTVYEQKTVMVPQQRTRTVQENRVVGTTEGPAVGDSVKTVTRKFGLTRAVIKLRYFATQ